MAANPLHSGSMADRENVDPQTGVPAALLGASTTTYSVGGPHHPRFGQPPKKQPPPQPSVTVAGRAPLADVTDLFSQQVQGRCKRGEGRAMCVPLSHLTCVAIKPSYTYTLPLLPPPSPCRPLLAGTHSSETPWRPPSTL